MNKKYKVMIPALLVAVASLVLVIYSLVTTPAHPMQPPGGGQPGPNGPHPDHQHGNQFITLLGNIAIVFGALSFWWFLVKKKLASPLPYVQKAGKVLYAVHTYTGYVALLLVLIHGGYYLLTDIGNHQVLSGLAGLLLILALAAYGWLYKRAKRGKNQALRQTHFVLSSLWLFVLIVHAGGFVVAIVVGSAALAALIWFLERKKRQATIAPEPNSQ